MTDVFQPVHPARAMPQTSINRMAKFFFAVVSAISVSLRKHMQRAKPEIAVMRDTPFHREAACRRVDALLR